MKRCDEGEWKDVRMRWEDVMRGGGNMSKKKQAHIQMYCWITLEHTIIY